MLPPTDLDGLSHADLKSLVLKLLEEAAELRRTVAAQRDEIARLKGGPGRPNIKPSGMDKATEPRPPPPTGSEPRQKGGKTSKLSIHEERTVTVAAPPQGSRFKGYTNFVVQDLVIRSHVVNFRRERWQKPDGDMMTAPLPAGISGHFVYKYALDLTVGLRRGGCPTKLVVRRHAAGSIFSLANGKASRKVCIGVLPKHQRP